MRLTRTHGGPTIIVQMRRISYSADPPLYAGNILAPRGRATASLPLSVNDQTGKGEPRVRASK